METISVTKLKAHLSEEIKKLQNMGSVTILDHKRPVAVLSAHLMESFLVKEAEIIYNPVPMTSLINTDPLEVLQRERADSW